MTQSTKSGNSVVLGRRGLPSMAGIERWTKRSGVVPQLLTLLLLVVVFAIGTHGTYVTWKNIQVILSMSAIPALIAVGLHQTVVLGGIDLSVEGVVALCVIFTGLLMKNAKNANDVGIWILPIVVGVGGVAGSIGGLLNTKTRIPSFIATLGMSWTLWGLAVFISGGQTTPILDERFRTLVSGNFLGVPVLAIVSVLLIALLQIVQDRTRFGRYLYAIGGDETVARQAGVGVDTTKIIVFALAGMFYGLAALLLATRLGSAQAITGNNLLFPAVTAVAVGGVALTGGIGGAKNAALGALIVNALNEGLILLHVSPYIQQAVNGVVLITAVALTIDRRKLGFIK